MSILYKNNQFHLQTKDTSYIFCIYDNQYPVHLYWGERIENDVDLTAFPDTFIFSRANAFHTPINSQSTSFLTDLQLEFSVVGKGDYRIPTANMECLGNTVFEFCYVGYTITKGKPSLKGLPATYCENTEEAMTLEIEMVDNLTGLHIYLCYTVFCDYNVITRNIRYENKGENNINLLSAQSASVEFYGLDYDLVHFQGDWARERSLESTPIGHKIISVESKRGSSSHMNNPFTILAKKNATEECGDVYGFCLVYSGSFSLTAEGSSCGTTRVNMGINAFNFNWELKKSESFQTPEVVLVYAKNGYGELTAKYHKIIRERLCRGTQRNSARPLVINNWEGTGMDFSEKKLLDIAKVASDLGLELFVLDDGWFGERNDDTSSLGDWFIHNEKLPNGLGGLCESINGLGMKFGLWFEPEMVSPKSKLYEEHPDWCIYADARNRTLNRNQLVLDLSKKEVCDYIIEAVTTILNSANIEYVKWDCNRNIVETRDQMQSHHYILGLYYIMETLTTKFSQILFEGCSGGGGRFDAGMLYYMPQIWTSDNTAPMARLRTQYGTSFAYPMISMTAHVGKIDVGYERENKYMDTCAKVAMAGNFGYELDLSLLSEAERVQAKLYVDLYKKIRNTIQFGDFYRLESPFGGTRVSWQFVDDKKAVVFHYQMRSELNGEQRQIKLKGLKKDAIYFCEDRQYYGEELMKFGIRIPLSSYEYQSGILVFCLGRDK